MYSLKVIKHRTVYACLKEKNSFIGQTIWPFSTTSQPLTFAREAVGLLLSVAFDIISDAATGMGMGTGEGAM